MAKPEVGEMLLHDYILPPLLAGRYRLAVDTEVKIDNTPQPIESRLAYFDVDAPRFTLAANEISGVFPPKNGHGPFDDAIPHIALGRRTLPWERLFAQAHPTVDGMPIPWLALLVFEDGEASIEVKQKIADKLPADVVMRLGVPGDQLVDTVTASRQLIIDLMPAYAELALLTHVREVNVADRELGAGDSDGFFAVVMSNRIPRRGGKYRCCLVSIEERSDIVPPVPPPPSSIVVDAFDRIDEVFVDNAFELLTPPGTVRSTERSFAINVAAGIGGAAAASDRVSKIPSVREREGDARKVAVEKDRVGALAHRHPSAVLQRASLVLLTTWAFECEGTASFRSLTQGLDVGLIGKPRDGGPQVTDSGHVRVEAINRAGAPETNFYRGPLVPAPLSRDPNGPYHSADQARRVAPEVGAEDVSYACAFEVGRLAAAADARLAQELMRWRRGAYRRAVRVDHLTRVKNLVHITELLDDRVSLAAFMAVRSVARLTRGAGPLADPFDLGKLKRVPGFDTALLQQTFSLQSVEHAQALLGAGATLLESAIDTLQIDSGQLETLDSVLRDSVGLARLQEVRGTLLDNVRTQLRDFGRLVR